MGVNEHLSKQFDAELESMRSRVLEMGGLVESQIRRAIDALASGDRALMDEVIAGDHRVNAMEVALERACKILSIGAGNMRFVGTSPAKFSNAQRVAIERSGA